MKVVSAQLLLLLSLFLSPDTKAQHPISLDAGFMQQINHHMPGLNGSVFYYFTEHFTGGVEVNRFFPKKASDGKLASWDVEINFHYLVDVIKDLKAYPIIGLGHTSEKETRNGTNEISFERFFSVNTGAGLLVRSRKWLPHIEYTFAWGHVNQQFFLAGISYELEFTHH